MDRELDLDALRGTICEALHCDPSAVTPEAQLREVLGATPLRLVELVMALEEDFGVFAEDSRVKELRTVGDLLDYWKELTNKDYG